MKRAKSSAPVLGIRLESDPGFEQRAPAPVRIGTWLASAIVLGAVFVLCAVFYVWLYVQHVENGYHLSKMCEECELLSTAQRKLTLDWAQFQDPQWLAEIGRDRFGLAPPGPDQKVVMR
ncbi:MAG: hypothetical protein M1398_06085 [Deltaproteobacteria bacterium]|jgi:hypothetical protein|nr:hypothetical protein [Deltaproteobacteria bacterium]MDA8305393.1 hypothetical protein [Deltaproteobacteria bacterium]